MAFGTGDVYKRQVWNFLRMNYDYSYHNYSRNYSGLAVKNYSYWSIFRHVSPGYVCLSHTIHDYPMCIRDRTCPGVYNLILPAAVISMIWLLTSWICYKICSAADVYKRQG